LQRGPKHLSAAPDHPIDWMSCNRNCNRRPSRLSNALSANPGYKRRCGRARVYELRGSAVQISPLRPFLQDGSEGVGMAGRYPGSYLDRSAAGAP
jgi:hypothetical protein